MREPSARSVFSAVAAAFCCALLAPAVLRADTRASTLYEMYEKLNTSDNLKTRYVGGRPPRFVEDQIGLLQRIADHDPANGVPVLILIVDEYLKRVDAQDPKEVYASPLQALQLPLVQAMAKHVESVPCRERLKTMGEHRRFREFARGAAVAALARLNAAKINPGDDADAKKRAKLLVDEILQDMSFSKMMYAPGRLSDIASAVSSMCGNDPEKIRTAFAGMVTLEQQYVADFAVLGPVVAKVNDADQEISDAEKEIVDQIARKYLQAFRPMAEKETYGSDVLGRALIGLGGREGFETLAAALRDAGIKVPKYEPPAETGKTGDDGEKRPPARK